MVLRTTVLADHSLLVYKLVNCGQQAVYNLTTAILKSAIPCHDRRCFIHVANHASFVEGTRLVSQSHCRTESPQTLKLREIYAPRRLHSGCAGVGKSLEIRSFAVVYCNHGGRR